MTDMNTDGDIVTYGGLNDPETCVCFHFTPDILRVKLHYRRGGEDGLILHVIALHLQKVNVINHKNVQWASKIIIEESHIIAELTSHIPALICSSSEMSDADHC